MGQVDRYTETDIVHERSDYGAEDMDSGDTCLPLIHSEAGSIPVPPSTTHVA